MLGLAGMKRQGDDSSALCANLTRERSSHVPQANKHTAGEDQESLNYRECSIFELSSQNLLQSVWPK